VNVLAPSWFALETRNLTASFPGTMQLRLAMRFMLLCFDFTLLHAPLAFGVSVLAMSHMDMANQSLTPAGMRCGSLLSLILKENTSSEPSPPSLLCRLLPPIPHAHSTPHHTHTSIIHTPCAPRVLGMTAPCGILAGSSYILYLHVLVCPSNSNSKSLPQEDCEPTTKDIPYLEVIELEDWASKH